MAKRLFLEYFFIHEMAAYYSEEEIKKSDQRIRWDSQKIYVKDLTSIRRNRVRGYVIKWEDEYSEPWEETDEYVTFEKKLFVRHYLLRYFISNIIKDFIKRWDTYKKSFEFFCSLLDNDVRRYFYRKLESKMNDAMKKILKNQEMRDEDEAARIKKIEEEKEEEERIKTMNKIFEDLEKAKKKKTMYENIRCANTKQRVKPKCYNRENNIEKQENKIKKLENDWYDKAKFIEGAPHHIPHLKF